MLIGGELVESESGMWDESINPATEEVIGPILSVMRCTSEDEAVLLANATEYGLTAAI